jgi:hypothetical protein
MAANRDLTLFSLAARAASTDGIAHDIDRMYSGVFYLNVTACTGGADTLDVKIQDSPDATTWYDVVAFTQASAATTERKTATNLGRYIRAVSTNGAGATATFSVLAKLNEA